jgi:small-conductance mechanosensitive channel
MATFFPAGVELCEARPIVRDNEILEAVMNGIIYIVGLVVVVVAVLSFFGLR